MRICHSSPAEPKARAPQVVQKIKVAANCDQPASDGSDFDQVSPPAPLLYEERAKLLRLGALFGFRSHRGARRRPEGMRDGGDSP